MKSKKKQAYVNPRFLSVTELNASQMRLLEGGNSVTDYIYEHRHLFMGLLACGCIAFLFDGMVKSGQNNALQSVHRLFFSTKIEEKAEEAVLTSMESPELDNQYKRIGRPLPGKFAQLPESLCASDGQNLGLEALDTVKDRTYNSQGLSVENEKEPSALKGFQSERYAPSNKIMDSSISWKQTLDEGRAIIIENPEPIENKKANSINSEGIKEISPGLAEPMLERKASFHMNNKGFQESTQGPAEELKTADPPEALVLEAKLGSPSPHQIRSGYPAIPVEKQEKKWGFLSKLLPKKYEPAPKYFGACSGSEDMRRYMSTDYARLRNGGRAAYQEKSISDMQLDLSKASLVKLESIKKQYDMYEDWCAKRKKYAEQVKLSDAGKIISLELSSIDLAFEARVIELAADPASAIEFGYDDKLPAVQRQKIIQNEFFKRSEKMLMDFLNEGQGIRYHVFHKAFVKKWEEQTKELAHYKKHWQLDHYAYWVLNKSPFAYYFEVHREYLEKYKDFIESYYKKDFFNELYIFAEENRILQYDPKTSSNTTMFEKMMPIDYPYTPEAHKERLKEWISAWGYGTRPISKDEDEIIKKVVCIRETRVLKRIFNGISKDEDDIIKKVVCIREDRVLKRMYSGDENGWSSFKDSFKAAACYYKDNNCYFPTLPEFHYWVIHRSPLGSHGLAGVKKYQDYIKQYYKADEANNQAQPPLSAEQFERWAYYFHTIKLKLRRGFNFDYFILTFSDRAYTIEEEVNWLQKHFPEEVVRHIKENFPGVPKDSAL